MLRNEDQARQEGFDLIIGVDEAGRGPLAGPVVASAVCLCSTQFSTRIADSKMLSPDQRDQAFHEICGQAWVGVGIMNESIIDTHNILQATFLAMNQAVEELLARYAARSPDRPGVAPRVMILVDGNRFVSSLPYAHRTIVKGDQLSLSIACASIIAKVTRDRILKVYDRVFPQYGFAVHKGYPTVSHKAALKKFGPSLIHRRSFQYA